MFARLPILLPPPRFSNRRRFTLLSGLLLALTLGFLSNLNAAEYTVYGEYGLQDLQHHRMNTGSSIDHMLFQSGDTIILTSYNNRMGDDEGGFFAVCLDWENGDGLTVNPITFGGGGTYRMTGSGSFATTQWGSVFDIRSQFGLALKTHDDTHLIFDNYDSGAIQMIVASLSGGNISFTNNSSGNNGGAISAWWVTLSDGTNTFAANHAQNGGAIGTETSGLGDLIAGSGGASIMTISGGKNSFIGNYASQSGGAIFAGLDPVWDPGKVVISGGTNRFEGNAAEVFGGAIAGDQVTINGGANSFTNNGASEAGGAIAGSTTISDGTNVFGGNRVGGGGARVAIGGAIAGTDHDREMISEGFLGGSTTISGGTNTFWGNEALGGYISNVGGAIASSHVIISGGTNEFTLNRAGGYGYYGDSHGAGAGGAIATDILWPSNNYEPWRDNGKPRGSITISGGENSFSRNFAGQGGAIYSEGGVTLSGGINRFTNNAAGDSGFYRGSYDRDGYGPYGSRYGSGGAIYSGGSVTLSGGSNDFIGNLAGTDNERGISYEIGSRYGNGGAIYSQGGVTLSGGINNFFGNSAGGIEEYHGSEYPEYDGMAYPYGYGGAIWSANSGVTISGGTNAFSGNSAGDSGGAIFGDTTISGGTNSFTSNTVGLAGGAIYGNQVAISGGTNSFFSNSAAGHYEFWGESFTASGGAIAASRVTISNGTNVFINNTAEGDGGAIGTEDSTTISGGTTTFSGNTAGGHGGAIYVSEPVGSYPNPYPFRNSVAHIIGGTNTFTKNTATHGSGGAIYSYYGTTLSGGMNSFSGNTSGESGGAIYGNYNTTITGGTNSFSGNTARGAGGAIYSNYGTTISGGVNSFSGNTAEESDGGAIYGNYGTTISGGANTFAGNRAENNGGAIYSTYGTTISGGTNSFSDNKAGQYGGAIGASQGSTTISGGTNTFSGNSAGGNGGAIYSYYGTTISGGTNTFENNSAGELGGAVYLHSSGTFAAKEGNMTFRGNTHRGGEANAIYMDCSFGQNLNLAAAAGKSILFYDPVESNRDYQSLVVDINGGEGYTGTVMFDTYQSKVYGDTMVHGGTMALLNGAIYGDVGNRSFTLGENATLVLDALASDVYSRIIADTITLNGTVTVDFSGYLANLANPSEMQTFGMMSSFTAFDLDTMVNGFNLSSLFVGAVNFGESMVGGWDSITLIGTSGYDYVFVDGQVQFTKLDSPAEVPEPGTLLILGLAVVAAPLARRFRRR
ncbi:MAG: PEP-CTERM sorting domain-containing protein [Thermoguttaceae bacterium]